MEGAVFGKSGQAMSNENSKDIDIINETAKACFNPSYLAERLNSILFNKTKHTSGHVHFHFRNKSDHIILTWSNGKFKKILAKSITCEKGQYVHWDNSQFCDYEPEDALRKLYNEIEHIQIDDEKFNKTWPSYTEFIKWVIEN